MTIGNLLLIAVLAGAPNVEALRRELDAVAARIEQLKAQRLAGESVEGELEPLLVRSQELAEELERARPEPSPPAPSSPNPDREHADELRDQAAALRGQAHRLTQVLAALEARIAAALRAATAASPGPTAAQQPSLPQATLTSAAAGADEDASRAAAQTALGPLVQQRARLEAHIAALRLEASRLEAQADALDGE